MTKQINVKEKSKQKQNKQNDTKVKKDAGPKGSDKVNKRTRSSNIKEEGFYKFKNMMGRFIKSQSETAPAKVTKRAKKRVKSGKSPK